MATMKEQIEMIVNYTGASLEKVLALNPYQFNQAYNHVVNLKENYGLVPDEVEEDCGCGGCEDALAECMEEDDLTYVTPEDLFEFIKSVYALIEVERGGDEV